MKLTVRDRLVFSKLFPRESDIITQCLVRDINKKVELSQAEIGRIGLKPRDNGPGLKWDDEVQINEEFKFTDAEMTFLQGQIGRLDKEKKIDLALLNVCLKIREGKSSIPQKKE